MRAGGARYSAVRTENLPNSETARRWWRRRRHQPEIQTPGEAQALFVWRDNQDHRDDIERHYLKMLTSARREVIIANAYFFPGYRLLHAMRNVPRGAGSEADRRGRTGYSDCEVRRHLLYHYLVKGGADPREYRRPLHVAKSPRGRPLGFRRE